MAAPPAGHCWVHYEGIREPIYVETWDWDDWDMDDILRIDSWAFVNNQFQAEWIPGHYGLFRNGFRWDYHWIDGHYVNVIWEDWTWFIHPLPHKVVAGVVEHIE